MSEALNREMIEGRLAKDDRDALLVRMTDDVADLVLEDNRLQALALSIAEKGGAAAVPSLVRIMENFEATGRLDRKVEGLAANDELLRRAQEGRGFTRPELAVLLSTAKLALQDAIEDSDLPDDPAMSSDLAAAFRAEREPCVPGGVETRSGAVGERAGRFERDPEIAVVGEYIGVFADVGGGRGRPQACLVAGVVARFGECAFGNAEEDVHEDELGEQRAQAGVGRRQRPGPGQDLVLGHRDALEQRAAAVGLALPHVVPIVEQGDAGAAGGERLRLAFTLVCGY